MSRRRTENRKRLRKATAEAKRRAWERIYDTPSARGEGPGPVMAYDLTEAEQADEEAE